MIRISTKKQIQQLLEDCYFGEANFQVTFGSAAPAETTSTLPVKTAVRPAPAVYVKISFIPNPEYRFAVIQGETNVFPFRIIASPGKNILKDERSETDKMEECVAEIPGWISRVKEEVIESNPLNREVQLLRAELEARISAMESSLDDYFTQDEAAALATRLSDLDTRVRTLSVENDELKASVAKLTATIESLNAALTQVNKGTWLRMAGGKLISFAKSVLTSKETREFALEAAKKLLLEGPK